MAITANVLTVYDGEVNATVNVIGLADAQGGQETLVVKIDVSELTPPCQSVAIQEIEYDVEGGVVTLLWDDLTPVPFLYLNGHNRFDYRREGRLQNAADPQSRSGDILLSATDFDPNGSYTILVKMRKKFS